MKVAFVILLVAASALAGVLTPEQINKLEPITKECRAESGITQDELSTARNAGVFEDNPKMRKHLLCVAKKTGLMSDSGDINIDALRSKLEKSGANEEKRNKILKCAVKKDNPEETAFVVINCIKSEQPHFSPAD